MSLPKNIQVKNKEQDVKTLTSSALRAAEGFNCYCCGTTCHISTNKTTGKLSRTSFLKSSRNSIPTFVHLKNLPHPTVLCQKCLGLYDEEIIYACNYQDFLKGVDSNLYKFEGILL